MSLTVAVCITTRNRCLELERTLRQVAALDPPADEILVVADGCTDATPEIVRNIAPEARLIIHEQARGSIPSRNEMARICACDLFLSLDDDSYPLERDSMQRIAELFEERPQLAVVTFPQYSDEFPDSLTGSRLPAAALVGSYQNSGAVIRRATFLQLGGYPDFFFHAYEEPDFALRCFADGWEIRLEPALTVRHHYSVTERSEIRTHHRHARNELWSVLMRCPFPQLLGVAVFRAARQFCYAAQRGWRWALREPIWWMAFAAGIPRCLRSRAPISWASYLKWMQLARKPMPVDSNTAGARTLDAA